MSLNPYYDYENLGLVRLSFDEPDMSYEYNTLCFWATEDGQVYTARDSGCSCPTPFEDAYAAETREEVLALLERVGSLEQAENTFDSWNKTYNGKTHLGPDSRHELSEWIKKHLKA